MKTDFCRIGFDLPSGLPNKEYALCSGILSLLLDRSGGINYIEYHGPRRADEGRRGAFYSNCIWRSIPFFPEPAIEFELETRNGPAPVSFTGLTLAPFGAASRFASGGVNWNYLVWVRGNVALIEWRASAPAQIRLKVREGFLRYFNDEAAWEPPAFDEKFTALRYNILRNFTTSPANKIIGHYRYTACSLIGCFSSAEHRLDGDIRSLTAAVKPDRPCRFAIPFGEDLRRVEWLLRDARLEWDAWLEEQVRRYAIMAREIPRLKASGNKAETISELVRVTPLFMDSALRERNGCQLGIRASTRGYNGVWNGWDGQWGFNVINACRSDDTGPRFLRFLDASRGPNHAISFHMDNDFGPIYDDNLSAPPMDRPLGDGYHINHEMWGVENLHQYYFKSGDRATLEKFFPSYARSLRTICSNASVYGLVGSCFGGADYAAQLDRPAFEDPLDNKTLTSRMCGVEDHAVLYSGLTQGAELAALLGDRKTVRQCARVIERLQQNYRRLFFNEENGYLYDAVWFKDNPVNRNAFIRLTALMAFYGYGEMLLLDVIDRIAAYVKTAMHHPALGLCYVPYRHPDNPNYARWDHKWIQNGTKQSLKLARLAGDTELLNIQFDVLLKHFGHDKLIHEDLFFVNDPARFKQKEIDHCLGWWQTMTGHAWWNGILESVAGFRYERGQIEHVPGDSGRDIALTNFHWGGRRWAMSVTGRGKWIREMKVNGRRRSGVCQVQPVGQNRNQEIVIRKTDEPPCHPVIISAGACPVVAARAVKNRLEAAIHSNGFLRLHFYSPARPCLAVNGRPVKFHWSERRSEGVVSLVQAGYLRVTIGS